MFTRGYKVPIDQLEIHHIKECKSIPVHAETLPGMVARCIANVFRKPDFDGKTRGFPAYFARFSCQHLLGLSDCPGPRANHCLKSNMEPSEMRLESDFHWFQSCLKLWVLWGIPNFRESET
jgi:hypothetical protein